ncbi:DUF6493 family protein [Lentzea sp. NPDC005914]|uniref:DUF6493 family protein n=1 Tax=Lentzea sp. NPDC005914 TaxID=3154572 RepID=UPI0034023E89
MTFDRIRALIESEQALALGEVLKSIEPEQRKELAKDLVAYEKKHRAGDGRWTHHETFAIAGAGLLPNASTLAPWLVRYQTWSSREDAITVLLDVLRHREFAKDLVSRLAAKLPRDMTRRDLLRVVLEFCGENPPDTDGFLLHFMDFGGHVRWRPGFDVLIPRLLEVAGSGVIFANVRQWRAFLRERADRTVLLDGCLARLQQGGGAKEMEGFLALHEELQVTLDETAEHARDYLAMLPDSRSTVATLAQTQLKRLDEAGRLDFGLLCDASSRVFGRTEKKLIRAQLTWLAKHARTNPDEVVLTVAELFAHESDDLRGQAVKLIAKHLGNVSDKTELRARAEHLPADLAAQFGVEAVAEQTVVLAEFAPRPFPEPFATVDELTREVMALVSRNAGHTPAVTAERIVEAIVRFAWQDREAIATAFRPIYAKAPWIQDRRAYDFYPDQAQRNPSTEFTAIIATASVPPGETGPFAPDTRWLNQLRRARTGSVGEQLALRLHEIAQGLVKSPRPALVCTPTELSGLLDPATLHDRLAKAEAEGWEPWPRDLKQAFHRLSHDVDPEMFASLHGNPGRLLQEWITSRTDPETAIEERTYTYAGYSNITDTGLYATVKPGLEAPEQTLRAYDDWGPMLEWWPSVLPAEREIVAAHLIPHLRYRTASKGGDGPLLPMLAEADGRTGPALHLALAYGLAAELTVNRAYAVDALLTLAARDQLDGRTLGDLVGQLLSRGDVALNRIVPGLRDTARSGAAHQIWDALVTALPMLWTHNRVADVIELAVEVAQRLKPGGDVDGLAEVAARKGSSKTVVQAKRLVSALSWRTPGSGRTDR